LIFENANLLSQVIDSFIFEITENKQHKKFKFTVFNEVSKFIFNHFGNKQTKYFSFNIVELYNNYKMWDNVVVILLEKYPQFIIYFENIKDFRKTGF
jgi:hypothetical protein